MTLCRSLGVALCMLLVGAAAQAAPAAPPSGRSLLEQAEKLYNGSGGRVDAAAARVLFEKAAATGDPAARLRVAILWHLGRSGFAKDPRKAAELARPVLEPVRRLAENGDAVAQVYWASSLLSGVGQPENPGAAVPWFRKAAEKGQIWAIYNLAVMHEAGDGVERDPVQALAGYRKAAELGHAVAMLETSRFYAEGIGTRQDPAAALVWRRRAAERRVPKAMGGYAWHLLTGNGVPGNVSEGLVWLRQAVALGDPWTITFLLEWFDRGEVTRKDREASFRWLLAEAEKGVPGAMAAVAYFKFYQLSPQHDPKGAFEWARRAAAKGSALGIRVLGQCYANGIGVAKDARAGFEHYRKAADAGDLLSLYWVGQSWFKGNGVPKADPRQGLLLYEQAAEQGLFFAIKDLAGIYENGWYGVPRDLGKARIYYEKAAALGDQEAAGWLKYEKKR